MTFQHLYTPCYYCYEPRQQGRDMRRHERSPELAIALECDEAERPVVPAGVELHPHELTTMTAHTRNNSFSTFNSISTTEPTRCSTAVHRRTLARSLTLPTFQVAEDFALHAATASFSLRFTAPLLAAEHFRLLVLSCVTACHQSYVGTVSGDLQHSTRYVSVHRVIS